MTRPRALRTILRIADEEPVTMRRFTEISGYFWEAAHDLLQDLTADNLLVVRTRREGSVARKEIRLTEDARRLLSHLRAIDEIHATAARRTRKGQRS